MTQVETVASVITPKFSIIIPTLNEAKSIVFFLQQLQVYRGEAELIVVDGGSSDDTCKLAEPLTDVLVKTEAGRARQMNLGAAEAKGRVLLFLHADTFLPDNALDLIESGLKQAYRWGRFDIRLLGQHYSLPIISSLMNLRSRYTAIATGDQVVFVEKALFDTVGHYPQIELMEDIALCKQLKKTAKPYCISQQVASSARRWLHFGVIKTVVLMWWLRLLFFFGVKPQTLAKLYREGVFWKL